MQKNDEEMPGRMLEELTESHTRLLRIENVVLLHLSVLCCQGCQETLAAAKRLLEATSPVPLVFL